MFDHRDALKSKANMIAPWNNLKIVRDRWESYLHASHSNNKSIARDMILVALFVFLGSMARATKEVMVAYRYGVSSEVDAYLFVFNVVGWPAGVWLSVLTVILVPLAARIRQHAVAELSLFRSELFGFALFLGLVLLILAWLALPILLQSPWIGLPIDTMLLNENSLQLLTLVAPLGIVTSLFSAWVLASGRHFNTMLEGVPAVTIVIVLLAFPDGGIEPLICGTIGGFALHLLGLAAALAGQREINIPKFTLNSNHWPSFWQGFGIMLAGQALMSTTSLVDQFFAAHLGEGAIAALGYANRILALILGMCSLAISRATLPVFSRSQAQGGEQINSIAGYWVRMMFLLGIFVMIVAWVLAPFGVRILFEHGAFSEGDTIKVAHILRYGLIQLPFYFAGLVFVTYLSSRGLYRWLFWSCVTAVCSKLIANGLFIPVLGVGGINIANAFMYAVNFVFFVLVFQKVSRGKTSSPKC
jgi:peptidoglycan biosynthesis protein MviN/MurJ (putative lipid II flippase)